MTSSTDPAELQRLLDRERAAARAAERARERSLLRQAGEETPLAAVLGGLSAQAWPVVVRTLAGRSHQGQVTTVGRDFCAVAGAGAETYLPLAGIATLRPDPGVAAAPPAHPRPTVTDITFHEALGRLAEGRPRVLVGLCGPGEPLAGVLDAVGVDHVTVLLDGEGRRPCYVALSALAELSVRVSG